MGKTQKQKKTERRSRYGMVKVRKGQKLAWLSKETKNGWSLGLAIGERNYWLKNVQLASRDEVKRAVGSAVIFVHKKGK